MMVLQDFVYTGINSLPAVLGKCPMYSSNSNFTPYDYCLSNTANILITGSQVPSNPNITVDNTF